VDPAHADQDMAAVLLGSIKDRKCNIHLASLNISRRILFGELK
jgi:hypothetical protein